MVSNQNLFSSYVLVHMGANNYMSFLAKGEPGLVLWGFFSISDCQRPQQCQVWFLLLPSSWKERC